LTSGGALNPGQVPQALYRAVPIVFTTPLVDRHFDIYPGTCLEMVIVFIY